MNADVIIIGGGLAGLTTAIYLSQKGMQVLVIEKSTYPKHKVCGEYVSNEVLPFLNSLGFDPFVLGAKKIDRFLLTSTNGKEVSSRLSIGGFSLSRHTFDAAFAEHAKAAGATIIHATVEEIHFKGDIFEITTKQGEKYTAKVTIGAYGKRSGLDKKLSRKFIAKSSPYLAVKGHYKGDFPNDLVALHNFKGGYCGLSKVENNHVNACYIADYASFKKYRNIIDFQEQVLYKNPHLKLFFEKATSAFEHPLSISQISFSSKTLIQDHVLMCGDSARMIHPLCGNGMSMAIQSAQLLSALVYDYILGAIPSRSVLEKSYQKAWNREFKRRLRNGQMLAGLFRLDSVSQLILSGIRLAPSVLPKIIEKTHGKPLAIV